MRTRPIALALAVGLLLATTAVFAQQTQPEGMQGRMGQATIGHGMKITVDGKMMHPSTPPLVMNGHVMLPMRSVFEQLGAKVSWNASRREVMATKGETRMTLRVGDRTADVNGHPVRLDVAPVMAHNTVYVPLRMVSEAMGASVSYNRDQREVAITTTGRQAARAPATPPMRQAQGMPANAQAVQGGTIMVDGKRLSTKAEPVMVGTTVMVPAQAVLEELKARPSWDAARHRLTATHAGQLIVVTAGSRTATVGDRTEQLSHAPFVYDNQVYVPLDFVGKALNATTKWEAARKEAVINTQARRVG